MFGNELQSYWQPPNRKPTRDRKRREASQVEGRSEVCQFAGGIDGHWGQLVNQFAGAAIAWIISIVGTLVLLFVVDRIVGLRLSPEEEAAGMDLSQHNEEGYDFNT